MPSRRPRPRDARRSAQLRRRHDKPLPQRPQATGQREMAKGPPSRRGEGGEGKRHGADGVGRAPA
eukprot:13026472-Alexandrium_andersonii.AAC.1